MAPDSVVNESMSEGAASPALPAASVDITAYRAAVASASRPFRIVPGALAVFGLLTLVLVLLLTLTGTGSGGQPVTLFALGVAGTGLLFALLVVLPLQLVTRRRRDLARDLEDHRTRSVTAVQNRLASIGYDVPVGIASRWLDADPEATIALVHDSVIAARLWQPVLGDQRVFVEAYLQEGETAAALPVLPPLPARK